MAEKQARCKSCGEPIRWVKTQKGKSMPIDIEPTPNGKFIEQGDEVVFVGKKPYSGDRYSCHFDTCGKKAS